MTQSLSDSKILDTIGTNPEAGYRMLLKNYKMSVYSLGYSKILESSKKKCR